jgi:hypothetical protein
VALALKARKMPGEAAGAEAKVQPLRPAAVRHLAFLLCVWQTLALLVAGCAGSRTTFSKVGQASRLPQNHLAAKLPAFEPQPPRQARRLPYFSNHFRRVELSAQNLVITNTGGVVTVRLTCPTDPGESTVLRASPPQNSAVRACRNFRIIGVCPAPVVGSADSTGLYTAEFGGVPVGKRLFVWASTMVDGFESLPRASDKFFVNHCRRRR